jgi:hypothetical protein
MHVYIDDSGDAGMKFAQGSTRFLVLAACVFREPLHIEEAAAAIQACREKNQQSREFKFARSKDRIKTCFFDCIKPTKFNVRAIVIDKTQIRSQHLIDHPGDLKSYAIRQLLTHTFGTVRDAKLVIDGQDTRSFQMGDRAYFMRQVNGEQPGTLRDVEFADSSANVLVQLADMVAGSVHRHVRQDDKQDSTHFERLRARTWQPRGSVWFYR